MLGGKKAVGVDFGSSLIKIVVLEGKGSVYELKEAFMVKNKWGQSIEIGLQESTIKEELASTWNLLKLGKLETSVILPPLGTIISIIKREKQQEDKAIPEIIKQEIIRDIPIGIEEIIFDYFIYRNSDTEGFKAVYSVARKKLVEGIISIFNEIGANLKMIDTHVTALTNTAIEEIETPDFIIIDMGYTTTKITVVENFEIEKYKNIDRISGLVVTQKIASLLNLNEEEAEKMKVNFSLDESITTRISEEIASELFVELISMNLGNMLDKYTIFMAGGAALMPGIREQLAKFAGSKVELLIPKNKVKVSQKLVDTGIELLLPTLSPAIGTSISLLNA